MNPEPATTQAVPASPRRKSFLLVLYSGVATSALALLGVYLLDSSGSDFNIMGLYGDYVIPAGAMIVGAVASSGYGIASWFSGVKISRSLLWTVLAIQIGVYFIAQYIAFSHLHLVHREDGSPVGFFEYYDFMARSFAWKNESGTGRGAPLGIWGYAFRLLEIVGFVAGSLIVPAILYKAPYCQPCQRYMRTRHLSLFAASVPFKKIKKSDTAGKATHQAEQEQAFAQGKNVSESLLKMAAENKSDNFNQTLAHLASAKKAANKLPHRIILHLISCNQCHSGWLRSRLLSGKGKQLKTTELARADVPPEFVASIR